MKISKEEAKSIYYNAKTFLINNWPNYRPSQGCLYEKEGTAYLLNADLINETDSEKLNLHGSTVTNIAGVLTAIVDITEIDTQEEVTAVLVHELFHVHQMMNWKKISFPNPEFLITYPLIYENENYRQQENELLFDIHKNNNGNLNLLINLRTHREKIIEDQYMDYERSIETFEGCAYYLENEYLRLVRNSEFFGDNIFEDMKLKDLSSRSYRIHYLSKGALLADVVNKNIDDWKNILERNEFSLYEIVKEYYITDSYISNAQIENNELKTKIEEKIDNDECMKNEFMKSDNLIEIVFENTPEVRMLDPMKMRGLSKGMIYHESCIQLGRDEFFLRVNDTEVLTSYSDSIWKIENIFLPLKVSSYTKNELLEYESDKITIKWMVKEVMRNEKGITRIVVE
ncbi:hypothetical protein RJG79_07620 [Mycoplasmatota bacterium WC44]